MTAGITVWVLTDNLSRTGVPTALHRILAQLDPTQRAGVHVIARHGGQLRGTVGAVSASTTVLEPADRRSVPDAIAAAFEVVRRPDAARTTRRLTRSRTVRTLPRPDVAVVEGAGGAALIDLLPPRTPVVTHLHELETGLHRALGPGGLAPLVRRSTTVLAVSEPVAALARTAGAHAVEIVPGAARGPGEPDATSADGHRGRRLTAREHLGVVEDQPVVVAIGAPGWRKGSDRFIALAHEVRRRRPTARFHWIGGAPTGVDATWVEAASPVTWHAEISDPWDLAAGGDLLVVTSREDPLPLVALEAGAAHLPVVATRCGGLSDLLDDEALVDGYDLRHVADVVVDLLDDGERRARLASSLHDRVMAAHLPDDVARTWWRTVVAAAEAGHPPLDARIGTTDGTPR